MTTSPLGLHRVIEPPGVLPQAAWRLDPSPAIAPDEVRIRVDRLNLDAASYRQIRETYSGDRDKIPFWLTIVCGIVGIFLGNWLYVDVLGGRCSTNGIDWLRHIVQVISAAVVVMVAASLTGRSSRRRGIF